MTEATNFKKYITKDSYTLTAFGLFLISVLFSFLNLANINLGIKIIDTTAYLINGILWILLSLSLLCTWFLAYKEKRNLMVFPILIWLIIFTINFRTANIPQLKDITTGEYTLGPDLDPFLYLRLAYEINNGSVPDIDYMRYSPLGAINYAKQSLMPWAIVGVYKIISAIGNQDLTYAAIITPVILFIISLIGFFFFIFVIFSERFGRTKSLIIALIASIFYSVSPEMLHRTTGGIPEIESLGMAFFWFAFLFFIIAWKSDKKNKQITYGIIAGLLTGLMSFSWGGYKYIYLILTLTAFIIFLINKNFKKNFIIFSSWLIPSIILELIRIKSVASVANNISGSGFAVAIFILIILHMVFLKTKITKKLDKKIPESISTLLVFIVLGGLIFLVLDPHFIGQLISSIIEGLLYPFGRGRVGLTVAENQAPYLIDATQQFGYLFWIFSVSLIFLFFSSIKHFDKKNRLWFTCSFIIALAGMLFSRYSSTSLLNGEGFIANLFYLGGIFFFIATFFGAYIKAYQNKNEKTLEDFKKLEVWTILLLSFSFWAIISMRGAIRLFFIISPIIIFIGAPLIINLIENRKKFKDDLLKWINILLIILVSLALFSNLVQYSQTSIASARATVPGIYENQWQKAMEWVRENTPEKSVFVHWWDYGYWVQSLGERPTVTDGGHAIGYWDHLTGRYLLTTPNPDTALSLMKSYNVSYLLIDSTDIGKYGAYSGIGSDKSGIDRFSFLPAMPMDDKQTQETKNSTVRVYQGATAIDEDIVYNSDKGQIFLPYGKAAIAAIVLETKNLNGTIGFNQPQGVFIYNNQQIYIPLRYAYYQNKLVDFNGGLESVAYVIPQVTSTGSNVNINNFGVTIYLSPKVTRSLFAQLYLMDDPFENYPTIKTAYTEQDPIIKSLNSQGANIGEIVYLNGVRGPIKIWKVNYPSDIISREEFLRTSGEYAEFDNLKFIK